MAVPYCPGEVVDVSGAATCQDDMGAPMPWESIPSFEVGDIDPVVAGQAFAGGFIIVGMAWSLGRAVRAILSMIR